MGQVGLTNVCSGNFSQKGETLPLAARTRNYSQKKYSRFRKRKSAEIVLLENSGEGLEACESVNLKNIHLKRTPSDSFMSVKTTKEFWRHATEKPAKLISNVQFLC